jgi:hypothetical protein
MSKALIELIIALQNGTNLDTLSYEIVNNKYIWIDYKKYESTEEAE